MDISNDRLKKETYTMTSNWSDTALTFRKQGCKTGPTCETEKDKKSYEEQKKLMSTATQSYTRQTVQK